ncbi:MAG TPA: ribonuclease HII [Candidatus Hydrogenedentes bacterium]|mgnify:FL=1|nr:ribonuclease HII [Candidatus Hydrogenedentota bacterium]
MHAQQPLASLRAAAAAGPPYDAKFLASLQADARASAHALYASCMRRQERAAALAARADAMMRFENDARANGFQRIAGVDEAGRGPLAGPIVAAAVVLSHPISGLNDSKQLTAEQRETLFAELHNGQHSIGAAILRPEIIDLYGIQAANYSCMVQAAAKLDPSPDFLLVDGFAIPGCRWPHKRLVKGDCLSQSIAAASIIAKVIRDRIMIELDRAYPRYGFAQHKGYGTQAHLDAIKTHGPCPAHRKSFAPVAEWAETGVLFPPSAR